MYCPVCGTELSRKESYQSDLHNPESEELTSIELDCPNGCYGEETLYGAKRVYVGKKIFDFGSGENESENDRISQLVREAISILRQSKLLEG